MSNSVLDGIMGLAVADALGVPVEFNSRNELTRYPVMGMRSFGTYNQPKGTWSDDTSLTLCLAESLTKTLDYDNIMKNFINWFDKGDYTAHGDVFDIGNTTKESLIRYTKGISPLKCGGNNENDNGNGSLMRILPLIFYLQSEFGLNFKDNKEGEIFDIIHNISSLTHRHKRSHIACGIYIFIASKLLTGKDKEIAVDSGVHDALEYYKKQEEYQIELSYFNRIGSKDFKNVLAHDIKSSGYVIDTLEAAIWCLLNTDDYKSCVLEAVNLGDDTDTVAAVAGGLAGILYGYKSIPNDWLEAIVKREYIEELCGNLNTSLTTKSVEKLVKYIPYLETAGEKNIYSYSVNNKNTDNIYNFGSPVYEDKLVEFIDEVYGTNLISYNYLTVIKNVTKGTGTIETFIVTADIKLLKAILTLYIRQERFNEGLWKIAVRDKLFLKIINRFREILDI